MSPRKEQNRTNKVQQFQAPVEGLARVANEFIVPTTRLFVEAATVYVRGEINRTLSNKRSGCVSGNRRAEERPAAENSNCTTGSKVRMYGARGSRRRNKCISVDGELKHDRFSRELGENCKRSHAIRAFTLHNLFFFAISCKEKWFFLQDLGELES